jgi:hypothetical protein
MPLTGLYKKMCTAKQLTPNYINLMVNGNNVQSWNTKPKRIHIISSTPAWFPKMARL